MRGSAGQGTISSHTHVIDLIGRDREVRVLTDRIDAASGPSGGALVVRGEAGIGKSSLLESARAHAAAKGFRILATTGVESESRLPFAGLHQLVLPTFDRIDALPDSYGTAIRSAFGLADKPANPYLVALSILHLLSECAESTPLLLLVDDAHWLDPPTAEALAFVARRLESDPIVLILAIRDGFGSPILGSRIAELTLEGLSREDALSLLDARAPGLTAELRERVVADAEGNPLALIELPIALAAQAEADSASSKAASTVTKRLVLAFAQRLSNLSPGARRLLQVASIDDSAALAELLSVASRLEGREIARDAAGEARAAGLVTIGQDRLGFRHPLIRTAIQEATRDEDRRAVHDALAAVLESDPDRRTWHRAAAAVGRSEAIASELDGVATRATQRSAYGVAMQALERASKLGEDRAGRVRRLLRAVHFASVVGRQAEVVRILDTIDDGDLTPMDRPLVVWFRERAAQKPPPHGPMIAALTEIAERMRLEGDTPGGIRVLLTFAFTVWWSNVDDQTRNRIITVAEAFPFERSDPRLICVLGLVAPVERGAVVMECVGRHATETPPDGGEWQMLGLASMCVGDFVRAERLLEASIAHCRAHGLLGPLASTLGNQAWIKILRGDWKAASSLWSECARWAEETGQSEWPTVAGLAAGAIAAYRGDIASAERHIGSANAALVTLGAIPLQGLLELVRGAAALAEYRYEEAYQHLKRIFDPADSAYHAHLRTWAAVDLVEAAVHSGHEAEASAVVRDLEAIAAISRSPLLLSALDFARPLLGPDGGDAAFQASLGVELASWPFTQARLQLEYGLWLRRQRRATDARIPLRAARDTFDTLGAVPWSERARQELRATGETSRRRTHDLADALSPQELQIAQLAAAGLSNKEIGQQLFLSHRTIGSHLYRIFPKLGVTARSHLRAALEGNSAPR